MTTRRTASFGLLTFLVASTSALAGLAVASCSDSPSGGAADAGRESTTTPDKDAACIFTVSDAKWKKTLTPTGLVRVTSTSFDRAGNIYTVGRLYQSADLGVGLLPVSGPNDYIFAAAFDKEGKTLWSQVIGETVGDAQESVAAFPEGGAVITAHVNKTNGLFFGGFVITRFDAAGGVTWTKEIGATAEAAVALTSDASAIVLAGGLIGALDLGGCPLGPVPPTVSDAGASGGAEAGVTDAGDEGGVDAGKPADRPDVFLARLSASDGACQWGKTFGGDLEAQSVRRVALDATGAIVVAGDFTGTFDLGGGKLVGPADSTLTGGLFLTPDGAAFVAKFTADGTHVWSRGFADTGAKSRSKVSGLVAMADGAIGLATQVVGTIDLGTGPVTTTGSSLAIFESGGTTRYAKVFPSPNGASFTTLASDSASNLYILGRTDGAFDFGDSKLGKATDDGGFVLASFGPSGAFRSARLYPQCSGSMRATAVGVAPSGDLVIAGAYGITNPAGPLIGTFFMAGVPSTPPPLAP
jgi:hypothetical protein